MRLLRAGGIALALTMIFSGSALADCKPLSMVTSVDFLDADEGRVILVPVTIAGKERYMIVDTGAAVSTISDAAADALGLQRLNGNFTMTNVSGKESSQYVRTSLKIGRLSAASFAMAIWHGSFSDDNSVVGLLGHDILQSYDLDIDMGNHKFNLMDPDHCTGKVIYWPASAVAVVPMTVMYDGNIQLDVLLDDKTVTAILDTGSSGTTLSVAAAEGQFGLKLGSADTPKTGSLTGREGALTYSHTFKTLGFEGIAVGNPNIEIIPDLFHSSNLVDSQRTGTRISTRGTNSENRAMLLGMNIMRHFHFYISYKEKTIYITPAAAPEKP